MTEELLAKIRKVLKNHGLEEEEITEVESELKDDTPAEETPSDPVEETPAPTDEAPVQEDDTNPVSEEVPSASEGDAAPVEEPATDVPPVEEAPIEEDVPAEEPAPLPEGVEEVDPSAPVVEESPVEPEAPVVAEPDYNALIGELQSKLEESEKARSGLEERIGALEEALKSAGIMSDAVDKPSAEVGIDDTTRTPGYENDDTVMEDVLAQINRKY